MFSLPDNLLLQLPPDAGEREIYYLVESGPKQLLDDGGVLYADREWERLTRGARRKVTVVWHSEELGGLSVCERSDSGRIPPGYWLFIVLLSGGLLLFPFLWYMIRLEILKPLNKLWMGMRRLAEGDRGYRIDDRARRNSTEMQFLFDNFDHMAEELERSAKELERSREKELQMVKMELDNLRLQVDPHMLLNSYNMIYSLAQTKNYICIQDYTMYLVEYFRYVLRKEDDFVSVETELSFIKNYIEIQKIRFPDAFTCVYQIAKDCRAAKIPPFLIENFIENSMKYALIPGERIEILLHIRREEDMLLISISDTGRGMKPEALSAVQKGEPYVDKRGNRHIGIWNSMRRVEMFYGSGAKLSIVSAREEGTQVFLRLPYRSSCSMDGRVRTEGIGENEAFDCG